MLAALFLWMIFFFASLSIMDVTVFNSSVASLLSVVCFNFLIKVRVVLCWYLFLNLLALLDLILFNADLWFAILDIYSTTLLISECKDKAIYTIYKATFLKVGEDSSNWMTWSNILYYFFFSSLGLWKPMSGGFTRISWLTGWPYFLFQQKWLVFTSIIFNT